MTHPNTPGRSMTAPATDSLGYTIRQQDGSLVEMRCADTIHNRQFVDFVQRHEPFGGANYKPEKPNER